MRLTTDLRSYFNELIYYSNVYIDILSFGREKAVETQSSRVIFKF